MKKWVLIAAALCLAGCGSLSGKEIAKGVRITEPPHYPKTVTVKVESFTEKTNYSINVEPKPLRDGIEAVLKRERIFSAVTPDGDYTLTAVMRRVDFRSSGFRAAYNSIVDWSLAPRGSSQKIWQERVSTEGAAGLGDALGGSKRVHLAQSWSFSRNIEEAMKRLQESHVLAKP